MRTKRKRGAEAEETQSGYKCISNTKGETSKTHASISIVVDAIALEQVTPIFLDYSPGFFFFNPDIVDIIITFRFKWLSMFRSVTIQVCELKLSR